MIGRKLNYTARFATLHVRRGTRKKRETERMRVVDSQVTSTVQRSVAAVDYLSQLPLTIAHRPVRLSGLMRCEARFPRSFLPLKDDYQACFCPLDSLEIFA